MHVASTECQNSVAFYPERMCILSSEQTYKNARFDISVTARVDNVHSEMPTNPCEGKRLQRNTVFD